MYRCTQLSVGVGCRKSDIAKVLASKLKVDVNRLKNVRLTRLSLDARDKNNILYKCSVDFDIVGEGSWKKSKNIILVEDEQKEQYKWRGGDNRIVVVGSGPSGLFCSLKLAESGANVTLLEMGYEMSKRKSAVDMMMKKGVLDIKGNIQFGEGGAGTFSDGKLNTGIHSKYVKDVLKTFYKYGAGEEVLYDAKPHVGTDVLSDIVVNMRKRLVELGVDVKFEHKVVGVKIDDEGVVGVTVEGGNGVFELSCDIVVFAIGHSSRDTIYMLYDNNIQFKQKAFSLGYRIEHLQEDINMAQYGVRECRRGEGDILELPPAEYKLVEHVGDRVVYTFCMCPGGVVVPATSEEGHVVTNGMSYNARDGVNSNSAILVSVRTDDFPSEHPLSGIEWQKELEMSAFKKTGDYRAVVQRVEDFVSSTNTSEIGKVKPSYMPGYVCGRVDDMLPKFVVDSIKKALPLMGKKLKGFDNGDAILVGIESRSSAPYQVVRDDNMMTNIHGVYVIGEGGGFAGGIVSSAVEGIKCAISIINSFS